MVGHCWGIPLRHVGLHVVEIWESALCLLVEVNVFWPFDWRRRWWNRFAARHRRRCHRATWSNYLSCRPWVWPSLIQNIRDGRDRTQLHLGRIGDVHVFITSVLKIEATKDVYFFQTEVSSPKDQLGATLPHTTAARLQQQNHPHPW